VPGSKTLASASDTLGVANGKLTEGDDKKESSSSLLPPVWLQAATSSGVEVHAGAVVECTQGFGTVMVNRNLQVECSRNEDTSHLRMYFEVQLITGGLMQIGWIDKHFSTAPPANDNDDDDNESNASSDNATGAGENGVGDDIHSWAYDGFRQMSWNAVNEGYPKTKKGKRKGAHDGSGIWKAGDIVGCLLDIDIEAKSGAMSFHLNGADLGEAFGDDCVSLNASIAEVVSSGGVLYPAMSLEEGQSAAINIGQRPFQHNCFPNSSSVYSLFRNIDETKPVDKGCRQICGETYTSSQTVEKDSGVTKALKEPIEEESFSPIDLESDVVSSCDDLEARGPEHLKAELARRGLKVGGTLQERAARLFAVKGLAQSEIPKKLLSKK